MAPTAKLFSRFAADRLTAALKDTPVVMVNGPRQSGKTTMVREFGSKNRIYVTMDDDTVLESVRNDPSGFVRGLDMAIVDEVQRAPMFRQSSAVENVCPRRLLVFRQRT